MKLGILASSLLSLVSSDPLALPSAAGTPKALYSVARPTGYSGPCIRLVRVSDSAQQDIGFNSSGYVDSAAALSWANGSAMKITTAYDLSGNGNHATQTTLVNMPDFSVENAINGMWPMTFNGLTAGTNTNQFLVLPASIVLDRANMSCFIAANPSVTRQANSFVEFNDGTYTHFNLFTFPSYGGLNSDRYFGGYQTTFDLTPRAQPNAFGITSTASGQTFFVAGQTQAAGAASGPAINFGGYIGKSKYGNSYNLRSDIYGIVFYTTGLSTPNGTAVINAFNAAYSLPTTFTARVILDGDSILEGIQLTGTSATAGSLQNWVRQMTGLKGTPEIFNLGLSGQTLDGCVSSFNNKVSALINGTSLPVIVGMEAATNDMSANSSATVKASAGEYAKLVKAAKPSAKIIFQTLLPRSGADNTKYSDYNTYIRGKSLTARDGTTVTAIDGVSDAAADPTIGVNTAPANTTLFADGTHPTKLGDSYIAPIWRNALNAQLP